MRPPGDPDMNLQRLHAEWRNAYAALGALQARARTLTDENRLFADGMQGAACGDGKGSPGAFCPAAE
ncbi:MAG: hypothetical protein DI563_20640 [Variovorax paradoxus]|uniref:Uncharacterized protein n=1 Tax=Variovorax paradoxus TaxID=34073 RepID=A0A2W5PQP1_VARPD|nr:MAG: hypothetical protein DI563_20640 [Variovorax paradoxus]